MAKRARPKNGRRNTPLKKLSTKPHPARTPRSPIRACEGTRRAGAANALRLLVCGGERGKDIPIKFAVALEGAVHATNLVNDGV